MPRLTVARRIWGIVVIVGGMVVVATVLSAYAIDRVADTALQQLRESTATMHRERLKSLAEAQALVLADGIEDPVLYETPEGNRTLADKIDSVFFTFFEEETEPSGYFFVYDQHGKTIAFPPDRSKEGESLWDVSDPNGVHVVRELIARANDGGGWVEYMWPKPGASEPMPKLSYGQFIPGTRLMLGTGVYTDDVEADVAATRAMIQEEERGLFILLGLVLSGYGLLLVVPATLFTIRGTIVRPLRRLRSFVETLGGGDLSVSASEGDLGRRDEIGELVRGTEAMACQMREMISGVAGASHEVASTATELSASSEQIARAMSGQQERFSEIARTVEEMGRAVTDVAEQTASCASRAEETGQVAETGGERVQKTVEGMARIQRQVGASSEAVQQLGDRGRQIGDVISVIDDIADQTNLLALNAAIEAARAGEHGRGFAVVADEVRKLADRTTVATREVSEAITAIQGETDAAVQQMQAGLHEVSGGVDRAEEAGGALSQIVGDAREVASMIQGVAAATEEQSAAGVEIGQAIESVQSDSEQTSGAAAEAASAAGQLSGRAEELRRLVERFKV